MIQQPIQQPTQQPICDSASQCSGNGIEHSWLGHGVAVSKAFAKSLIPMEDPCLSFNSRKAVEDLLRLATTTIVPASSILFMAKDMASAWSGSGLSGQDAKPELPQTSKETREEAQEKEPGSKDVPLQQSSTARYQVSQGTKGLLALGTLASSFQYANSKTIYIKDAEDLGKIGRYSDYPSHGTYQQTADIVVNNHRPIGDVSWWGFTGEYDGQCHTISGLSDCFVKKLRGSISNLQFTGANIRKRNSGPTGLVACVVAEAGKVSNIRAKDVHICTWGYDADAGIGGGRVKGKVGNIMALNSTVETKGPMSDAGIGGGEVFPRGIVGYITAVNCNVTTLREGSSAAIGGGLVKDQFTGGWLRRDGGKVAYTTAVNCRVETKGRQSHAAIGGGLVRGGGLVNDGGKVDETTAVNCYVTASGKRARAGIGKGWGVGIVTNTKVVDNPNDPLLCQKADLRVFTDHCSAIAEFRDALALSVCPLPKKIYDAETLGKIGRHPDYPPNGNYYQTADIVVNKGHKPIGNDTHPFTGKYDGQCHAISGLSDCFVDTLEGCISDLQFTRANITNSAKPTGLAACVVDDTGTVSNIRAKDVHIVNSGDDADAGIGGGRIKGMVANIMAVDSTVETKGPFSDVGIGGGEVKAGGTVGNTAAVNSNVTTEGESAYAGIGGGQVRAGGKVTNTTAVNSHVITEGESAYAGIGGGGGLGEVAYTTAVNSRVETSGKYGMAGIGGGAVFDGGTVAHTTAVNCTVETRGIHGEAGIGGGLVYGTVANTTAVNSHVITEGESAYAGIGGGAVYFFGTVAKTTAVNSNVTTEGEHAYAGIEAGKIDGTVDKAKVVNSFVNGNKKNFGSISNDQLLCQKADLRVLTGNCSARTEFRDALDLSFCPVNAATVPPAAKESTPTTASTAATVSTDVTASTAATVAATVSTAAKESTAAAAATVPTDATASTPTTASTAAKEPTPAAAAATVSTDVTASTPTTASTAAKEPTPAAAAATVSTDVTASTAATVGITTGSLLAGGLGLGIAGYSTYQWITGYQAGLRGQELAMKPLTRGKELASAAVNSVFQGIQGIRERMNRQSVPAQEPPHE